MLVWRLSLPSRAAIHPHRIFSGHLFAFRGKSARKLKILFWDGNGLCLFTKRLDQGGFIWPRMSDPGGTVTLSPAQLAMLIEGLQKYPLW